MGENKFATCYFENEDTNRAVILLHAYTGSPNDVRMLGRFLQRNGYATYLPLFEGHGTLRPEDILEVSKDAWWQNVVESIHFLQQKGYKKIGIFGLSLGGLFALNGVSEFPEVIVGGGTFCSPLTSTKETNIVPVFLEYCKTMMKKAGASAEDIETRLLKISVGLKQQLTMIDGFIETLHQKLPTINQPVLLTQAGKDKMVNPNTVYEAEKMFHNDIAEVIWYPESGHVITVGPERKKLEQDVLTFLNNLSWDEE